MMNTGFVSALNSAPRRNHLFVQVWLINKEGLFLSQERSENISWPLMWCANGGNAKMGEDAYTCARREVLEELKTIMVREPNSLSAK